MVVLVGHDSPFEVDDSLGPGVDVVNPFLSLLIFRLKLNVGQYSW